MKRRFLMLMLGSTMAMSLSAGVFAEETETEVSTQTVSEADAGEATEGADAEEVTEAASDAEEASEEADDGADYLSKIQGSYIELFPEMDKEEYRDIWLEKCGEIVGEENAEASTDALLGMCMAEIYGQEAIDAYAEDESAMAFDCYFLGGVETFTVEGNIISGTDENGEEVFSHAYDYVETDENGFYLFQSEDEDSGQFTWFCFAPDTMEDTYHLEFRYSDDEADLASWYEGDYAYWNAAGIAADYDEQTMEDVITLFATENLSAEAE